MPNRRGIRVQHQPASALMRESFTLTAGSSVCTVCPALGGSLIGWTVNGQAMLRDANSQAIADGDTLGSSSFPLVPYSNRIGHGRFDWEGQSLQITPNFPPEPHAIHGTGWEDVWQAERLSESQLRMTVDHPGGARWPWPFQAEQLVTVHEDGLGLALTATNLADEPAPLAFGHHPYFDSAGASLAFKAAHVWEIGEDGLPSHPVAPDGKFDFSAGVAVEGRAVDHCYAGVSGPVRIRWHDRPLMLEIDSALPAAVIFIPKGGASFCFEPVPHINNALNLAGHAPGMPVIAPGERFEAVIAFRTTNVG